MFKSLPGFPFASRYLSDLPDFEGLRVHYLDEGPIDASTVFLCLHGEPTWSYLYRKMIPVFTAFGHRVVAPDLLGFGRSDKPADDSFYSFGMHRRLLLALISELDLRNICLVCQDWGGILGLTLPLEFPDRFTRLIVMNTTFAIGAPISAGFDEWRTFARANPAMDIPALMLRAHPQLSLDEANAYGAPFPDARFMAGVRRFPELVMTAPGMEGADLSRVARKWWQEEWRGASFMAVGMQDPVLGPPVMADLRRHIRGCPEPMEIADAGHFVQESGADIAGAAIKAFGLDRNCKEKAG